MYFFSSIEVDEEAHKHITKEDENNKWWWR